MNKIIRRLAIVAVAAVICSGPGLAWGAIWLGTGANATVDFTGFTSTPTNSDVGKPTLSVNDDGAAGERFRNKFAGDGDSDLYWLTDNGGMLSTSPTSESRVGPMKVTFLGSNLGNISAWGAQFYLLNFVQSTVKITATYQNLPTEDVTGSLNSQQRSVFVGVDWTGKTIDFLTLAVIVNSTVPESGAVENAVVNIKGAVAIWTEDDDQNGGRVPEPTTLAIWSLLSLIGLAVVRRRRRV